MTDLIQRLKARDCAPYCDVLSEEAAAALEAQQQEIERLRGVLMQARESLFIYDHASVHGIRPGSLLARIDAFLRPADSAPACQHDLQEPACTVRMIDLWTAQCSACETTFVLPRPKTQQSIVDENIEAGEAGFPG